MPTEDGQRQSALAAGGGPKEGGAGKQGSESQVGRRGKDQGKRIPNLDENISEILRLRLGRKAGGVRRPVGPGQQRRNDWAWTAPQNRFSNRQHCNEELQNKSL